MTSRLTEPTSRPKERAFLVGVNIYDQPTLLTLKDSLSELALLAKTAGLDVVGKTTQNLKHPNSKTYIGKGKVEEVKALVEDVGAEVVIFDDELSPRHLRELESIFDDIRILDRTALILDIFAQHAITREGALQVELAQYEYRLPRLTRAWTHLARQAGGGAGRSGSAGGVGLRGPGETQIEVDRRMIRKRIAHLKEQLEKLRVHRQQYRSRRQQSSIPIVALVGYTNAGKSTLLNRLAGSDIYVADQLFATLDPTTKRVEIPDGQMVLFTDTVGFIQKLPTQLVAAFRATLEEITDADLLLHVIDITHPNALSHAEAVYQTLAEINADRIQTLSVLNKIDKLSDSTRARNVLSHFPDAVAISALTGEGMPDLLQKINDMLFEDFITISVYLPYQEGGLISQFHQSGIIEHMEHVNNGINIRGKIPRRLFSMYKPYTLIVK
jgi:GTP-binding protein HflX